MRKSASCTNAGLWSVAKVTVVPPTNTGCSTARRLMRPVRPTAISMSRRTVDAVSAAYLYAAAQRGVRLTTPRESRALTSSVFTTAPSMGKPSPLRRCPRDSMRVTTSSGSVVASRSDTPGTRARAVPTPQEARLTIREMYESSVTDVPDASYAANDIGASYSRSLLRKHPATALREFTNGGLPEWTRLSLALSKSLSVMKTSPRTSNVIDLRSLRGRP